MKMFPLVDGGEFSENLSKSLKAAQKLSEKILESNQFKLLLKPELDIVVWAPKGKSLSEISQLSDKLFADIANKYGLHLALIKIPIHLLNSDWAVVEKDQETVTCLRSCLMKPEHLRFVDEMWEIICS
jgi:glutamate/tyrosine decarboxylase-like PLP-dependent enzyme